MKKLFSLSVLALGMALAQPSFACDCDKKKEGKNASCSQGKVADGKTCKDGKSCGCGDKAKEEKGAKPTS